MATGTIPYASVPGWPNPPLGLFEACQAAVPQGFVTRDPTGIVTSDVATVTAIMSAYSGGASELTFHKMQKQMALDALFDASFDLAKFIRAGTSSTITAANVGAFLAQTTNNYRSLRAQIAAGATVAIVDAININNGWPANP